MTGCGASRRSRSHGWFLGWLLAFFVASTIGGSAVVADLAHAYDAPAVALADGQPFAPAEANPTQLSGSREWSALRSAVAPGASTTSSRSFIATEGVGNPIAGGGGSLEHLTPGEAARIQNAANKIDQPISVVGSRAAGTAGPYSDWDYVVEGANSSTIGKIRNSLPDGVRGIGDPRNLDIFRGTLDTNLPHITFNPVPR